MRRSASPRDSVAAVFGDFVFWVERERAAVVGEAEAGKKTMERKKGEERRACQHFISGGGRGRSEDDMRGRMAASVRNGR